MSTVTHDDIDYQGLIGSRSETITMQDLKPGGRGSMWINPDPVQYGSYKPDQNGFGVGYLADDSQMLSHDDLIKLECQLTDQIKHLKGINGTSRAYAEGYSDWLPEGFAMESFTPNVSKVNYGVSLESLTTALKIVGAVILLGAVGALAMKLLMVGRRGSAMAIKRIPTVEESAALLPGYAGTGEGVLLKFKSRTVNKAVLDCLGEAAGTESLVRSLTVDNLPRQLDDAWLRWRVTDQLDRLETLWLSGKYEPIGAALKQPLRDSYNYFEGVVGKFVTPLMGLIANNPTFEALKEFLSTNRPDVYSVSFAPVQKWAKKHSIDFSGNAADFQEQIGRAMLIPPAAAESEALSWKSIDAKSIKVDESTYRELGELSVKFGKLGERVKGYSDRVRSTGDVPKDVEVVVRTTLDGLSVLLDDIMAVFGYLSEELHGWANMVEWATKAARSLTIMLGRAADLLEDKQLGRDMREEITKQRRESKMTAFYRESLTLTTDDEAVHRADVMVMESISTAGKVLIGVGLLALLGGAIVLLKRLSSDKPKEPKLSQATQAMQARHKTEAFVVQLEKTCANMDFVNNKLTAIVKQQAKDLNDVEAFVKAHQMSFLVHAIMAGKYRWLMEQGGYIEASAKTIEQHIEKYVIPDLETVIKKGDSMTVADMKGSTQDVRVISERAEIGMATWANSNGMGHGLRLPDQFTKAWESYISQPLPSSSGGDFFEGGALKKWPQAGAASYANALKILGGSTEKLEALAKTYKAQDSKPPKEVVERLKRQLDNGRNALQLLDIVRSVHDMEVQAFDQATRNLAAGVTTPFKDITAKSQEFKDEGGDIVAGLCRKGFESATGRGKKGGKEVPADQLSKMSREELDAFMSDPDTVLII